VACEPVEDRGDVGRDAGTHEHRFDAGQHRPVQRGQGGQLDLLQVVDPDHPVGAGLGHRDLGEVGQDQQFQVLSGGLEHRTRDPGEAGPVGSRLLAVVPIADAGRDLGDREGLQGSAHVPARITLGQPARDGHGHGGAGDHAELAEVGHGLGELPARGADAHPTLHDDRFGHGALLDVGAVRSAAVRPRTGDGFLGHSLRCRNRNFSPSDRSPALRPIGQRVQHAPLGV